ncbi:MAG: hypothetical protein K9H49_04465 [Bacteroidales bacterium]|nr:hypothetical protein [Bacteroidales bacterium]MCF8389069.1 hypothetical protein [Bacteroidales bacterium]
MISKVTNRNYSKLQLFGAGIGTLIGMVLLMSLAQFYFEMNKIMDENRDLIDPEFLVINKKISLLATLNIREATFTAREIEEVRSQPWASKVEGFISNQFALSAYTESENFPDFYTDLFFEAIPDEYLDVKDEAWLWQEGDQSIPIILPKDYINLYNFGFAPSQGLPQISPATIGLVNFTISIRGQGKQAVYNGKIIGFSSRVNSVLTPWNFLNWANKEYGSGNSNEISRLVVETKNPTDPEIISFLNKHSYETLLEKLKSSRLNILLKFIVSFLGSLGIFIILLAFGVFILSFQLLISKSGDEIRKLKWLGYHYKEISKPYIQRFGLIISIIFLLSFLCMLFLKQVFMTYTLELGLELSKGIDFRLVFGGIIIVVIMFIINTLAILRQTKMI